ncbi:hypothetical protein [Rhizobium sp. BT-175]|uniref:hypothetical protein n=1 Tax=Rhizobium sp. BT-175 TaxID=2986929 RepID=UPI002236081A|nr:hypothetical protein [Rhizobium sp. BT-175]MCV9942973.1 hypothetical protein [Rhizobium sp. BT-175]
MNSLMQSSSFSTPRLTPLLMTGSGGVAEEVDDVFKGPHSVFSAAVFPKQPNDAVPSDLDQRLYDSGAVFKILASQVSMHLGLPWIQKLFSQIDGLLDVDEWDPRDPVPSQETVRTFIRMLLILKVQRKPGLGVSNAGNLIAAWTAGANRLTVECFARDRVRWVVSRDVNGETERAAGEGRLERLRDFLTPYNPSIWFEYGEQIPAR